MDITNCQTSFSVHSFSPCLKISMLYKFFFCFRFLALKLSKTSRNLSIFFIFPSSSLLKIIVAWLELKPVTVIFKILSDASLSWFFSRYAFPSRLLQIAVQASISFCLSRPRCNIMTYTYNSKHLSLPSLIYLDFLKVIFHMSHLLLSLGGETLVAKASKNLFILFHVFVHIAVFGIYLDFFNLLSSY